MLKKLFFPALLVSFFFITVVFAQPIFAQEDAPWPSASDVLPIASNAAQVQPPTQPQSQSQLAATQDERLEGTVTSISDEKEIQVMDKKQLYQKLNINITEGSLKGQTITVENGNIPVENLIHYQVGDQVVLTRSQEPDGSSTFVITDFVRRDSLLWLLMIFVGVTVLIGRIKGFTSIVGMVVSFVVIFLFILPKILDGQDPVMVTILGSLIIIPVSFFLSHGLNKKTLEAILGTLVSLMVTGVLANIFVAAGKLSGFVSEESGFLQEAKGDLINIKGLLLAGIIIGVLGILDDVTISQSAVVQQLKQANSKLSPRQLYQRAMAVGRDHIASMVNTLVLVYAGASMPLLLLFINNPHPFSEVINYEIIADEVIRTLVGSIGLVLAVPLTTLIAVLLERGPKEVIPSKDS